MDFKIGETIHNARLQAGISQEDLAKKVGMTRNAIQKIEYGERMPSIESLLKLCEALNIKIQLKLPKINKDIK